MDSPRPFMPIPIAACLPLTAEREAELRRAVVAEAMKWNGARYIEQACVPYVAIDCAMLLVACWIGAGVVEPFDPRPYPPRWHLHRSEERYLNWMSEVARETETPQPGDVALWQFGRCFSHAAIIVNDRLDVMHARADDAHCSMTSLDEGFLLYDSGKPRPRKFFDIFAKYRDAT